jgi:iron complex outermembrane receptor protein
MQNGIITMKKMKIISVLPIFMLSFPAFSAEEQSVRLQDTIVSTNGFSTTTQEESKNVSVISNEDIENKGYTDISEIFINSPYINVKSGEKGSDRNIDMRGQGKESSSKVKVMVDGIPLNILDTSHSQSPLNSINPSQIDQIEIIPGGGSVLYGNNATGGTVNIITKADNQKEYIYVQNLYKSYNTNDLSLGFGQKLNDKFYLNFDYGMVDGDGYRDLDSRTSHFAGAGITYNITENQKVSFTTKYSKDNGTTSDGISKEQIEQNRKQAGGFISDYKNKVTDYAIKYDGKFSDSYELSAKAYYQEIKSDIDGFGLIHYGPTTYDGSMIGEFNESKTGSNIKQKYTYSNGSIVTGYDFLQDKLLRDSTVHMDIPFAPPPHDKYDLLAENTLIKDTHSVFAILDQKIIGGLKFNAGYRYEWAFYDLDRTSSVNTYDPSFVDTSRHDNNQAYNVGLSYDINPLNKVYVSYERGYVSPSPVQLTNKDDTGYIINDIKSQTGDNYEIGYKGYALNSYFSLTTFYSQNNDEIVRTGDEHRSWEYNNLDKTRRSGVEAFAEQNVWKFTFTEGATYINTRILEGEFSGQQIATVPDYKVVLSGKYEVIEKLNIGLRGNYTGEYVENNKIDTADLTTAPSVITADFFLDYSPINRLYFLAGINNLFNEKYNLSQDSYGNYIVAPERNYYLGLKYEF